MIRRSRYVVVCGLVFALGVAGLAFADGVSENTPKLIGKVSPSKLDKKKFKPVKFMLELQTDTTHAVPGQQNPEAHLIEFGKNVKFKLSTPDICTAPLFGTTTEQAKALCPKGSNLGTGNAHADLGGGPDQVADIVVTAFNGPSKNHIRLHAYSPSLGAANTQVVDGDVIKAPSGGKYGQALSVKDAPDLGGDAFMLTLFGATVSKSSKAVLARCRAKRFLWHQTVTYDDGSKETADFSQPCKVKK